MDGLSLYDGHYGVDSDSFLLSTVSPWLQEQQALTSSHLVTLSPLIINNNNMTSHIMTLHSNDSANEEYDVTGGDDAWQRDPEKRIKAFLQQPYNILNVCLASIAISSNVLSLLALTQVRSTIPSYFKLLMSLAISDIFIGVTLITYLINSNVNTPMQPGMGSSWFRIRTRCTSVFLKSLHNTGLNSTVLNLMVMAVDHYIAILRPLHYHLLVNKRRKYGIIALVWIIATLFGFSDFVAGIFTYHGETRNYNYCEHIYADTTYQEEYVTLALSLVCLCTMSFIYIRIYMVVRAQQSKEQQQSCDMRKNKKALITTLLILGSFMVCWLPNCLLQVALIIQVQTNPQKILENFRSIYLLDRYLLALLFINAICDPIIYATRLREVRHGYYYLFGHCCKRFYSRRMVRRFSTTSNTLDYAFNGSIRRMSMLSRRGSVFSSDSSRITASNSVYSSQSVPMLSSTLGRDTGGEKCCVSNGNGVALKNGGLLLHQQHHQQQHQQQQQQREKQSNGLHVRYQDEQLIKGDDDDDDIDVIVRRVQSHDDSPAPVIKADLHVHYSHDVSPKTKPRQNGVDKYTTADLHNTPTSANGLPKADSKAHSNGGVKHVHYQDDVTPTQRRQSDDLEGD